MDAGNLLVCQNNQIKIFHASKQNNDAEKYSMLSK
jgi:hypothetical protein